MYQKPNLLVRPTAAVAPIVVAALFVFGCERKVETVPAATPAAPTATPANTAPPPPVATPPATTGMEAPSAGVVTVADITGDPARFLGQTVTVIADVDDVKGPRAFTLNEDSPTKGGVDNDLLVLSPKAGTLSGINDDGRRSKVRVTGVVRNFVAADVEREVGWDIDRKIEMEFEGKRPVLIAQSVDRIGSDRN